MHTFGFEPFGETWTKSKDESLAMLKASSIGIIPFFSPSEVIKRTLSALIASFMGVLGDLCLFKVAIFLPACIEN